jgi:hypothetical protein
MRIVRGKRNRDDAVAGFSRLAGSYWGATLCSRIGATHSAVFLAAVDKPSATLETPRDLDRVSSFLNIRVKDIEAVHAEWPARGPNFLTPPKQHQYEIRGYIRDPDGHLIEVGQTTDPDGDWTPAHWPLSTPAEGSE